MPKLTGPDRLAIGIAVAALVTAAVVGAITSHTGASTLDTFSAIGSVASLFGLAIVVVQIIALRRISLATADAVREAQRRLVHGLSVAEVSRTVKLVQQAQTYVGEKQFEAARITLQDVRGAIIQLSGNQQFPQVVPGARLERLLADIGTDLLNLFNVAYDIDQKAVDVHVLNAHFEELIEVLLQLEAVLTLPRGDT